MELLQKGQRNLLLSSSDEALVLGGTATRCCCVNTNRHSITTHQRVVQAKDLVAHLRGGGDQQALAVGPQADAGAAVPPAPHGEGSSSATARPWNFCNSVHKE